MNAQPSLPANTNEIDYFVKTLFRHARGGTVVSLRTFDQLDSDVRPSVRPVLIGPSLDPIIQAATQAAQRSASTGQPTMFAPPIATFGKAGRARSVDVADGLAITVDLDANPSAGRAALEALLGPPTVAVASGSTWNDPATGRLIPKLHLHWRLREPTRDQAGHTRLREARWLAAKLGGGDASGASIAHPFRWPGSWNRKKSPPTLACIVAMNEAVEIDLEDALERLSKAAGGLPVLGSKPAVLQADRPLIPLAVLKEAMSFIPNEDPNGREEEYHRWIRFGLALWNETGGAEESLDIWDDWSAQSAKYRPGECAKKWGSFRA